MMVINIIKLYQIVSLVFSSNQETFVEKSGQTFYKSWFHLESKKKKKSQKVRVRPRPIYFYLSSTLSLDLASLSSSCLEASPPPSSSSSSSGSSRPIFLPNQQNLEMSSSCMRSKAIASTASPTRMYRQPAPSFSRLNGSSKFWPGTKSPKPFQGKQESNSEVKGHFALQTQAKTCTGIGFVTHSQVPKFSWV